MAEYLRRLYSLREDIDRRLEHLTKKQHPDVLVSQDDAQYIRQGAEQLLNFFQQYGFEAAGRAADRIQPKSGTLTPGLAKQRFEELWEDFLADCNDRRIEIIGRDLFRFTTPT